MKKLLSVFWVAVLVLQAAGHVQGSGSPATPPTSWSASYDMMLDGPRTYGDEFLDASYQFKYGWSFNLQNFPGTSVPNARIAATWTNPIAGIRANTVPPVTLDQTSSSATWSVAELGSGNAMSGNLSSTKSVPQLYALGYEVRRQMLGGRLVSGGATAERRTFTLEFITHDPALTYIGASVNFTGLSPNQNPGPVSTSDVSCTDPSGGWVRSTPGTPVFWKIGEGGFPPLQGGIPYVLTCTLNVTNSAPSPVSFTPEIVVTARRVAKHDPATGSVTYTSPGMQADPPDPLEAVTFDTGASDATASLESGLSRTVWFNGVNGYDDHTPPTTTATVSPHEGWNNGPMTVMLDATDPGGSGVKQVWYQLQPAGLSPSLTSWTSVPGSTATISGFPLPGATALFYYAEDYAGNRETFSTVNVRIDTTPPSTTAGAQPPPTNIGGQNWWKANSVTVMLNASDPCSSTTPCSLPRRISYKLDGAQTAPLTTVNVAPSSPNASVSVSVSAEGTTTVTYYAEDLAGNVEESKTYTVNIDRTSPVLSLPSNMIKEATGPTGAFVTFTASANDALTCSPASGSLFPLGVSTVNCSAADAVGNRASGAFTVTIRESSPPVIGTVTASPGVIWPPNHKMVPIALGVTVSDNVTLAPACRVVSVTSNEPLNGSGDGNTAADYSFSGVGLDVRIRAERAGTGTDRIYSVAVVCRDAAGNDSLPKTVAILVPHDNGKK